MIEIVIFILPNELDDLGKLLDRLSKGSKFLTQSQKNRIKFSIVLGISDEIIDWDLSKVSKKECIDQFLSLKKYTKWAKLSNFTPSEDISGCTTMRVNSSHSNSDYYLWLDSDIVFDPLSLSYFLNSIPILESNAIDKFILSPEIVRIWDETWDCLVNEKFKNKPLNYHKSNNPYTDTQLSEDAEFNLVEVNNRIINQPYMKFAGGWFNLISKKLLSEIPLPIDFSHYGWEDTYIMYASHLLNNPKIKQFKIKNIIVCENYYDRVISFKNEIMLKDRREEYRSFNQKIFLESLKSIN